MKSPFLGAFSVSRSRDLSDCQCINLFPEYVETAQGKEVGALYMTPGLTLKATAGAGPIRGLKTWQGNLYALTNNTLVKFDTAFNQTSLGTGGNTQGSVSFVANPTQIAYFDGVGGFSWNGTTFASISLPFVTPGIATEQDGFVLVNQKSSNKVWQSNLNDLTTWNALNFTSADARPENVQAIFDLKRQVYVFKEASTEIWVNQGNPGFVFQRIEGVFIEQGTVAPFSIAKGGESLFWLSQSENGNGMVLMTGGVQPERISTHALEYRIGQYSTISDAIGYCYQDEGHMFYVLTFPTAGETWVYDATYGKEVPSWHMRAAFSNGAFSRHQGNCYAFFNGQHIIGDYQSGKLYALDMDTYTDAGAQRKWLRTWRALKTPVFEPVRFESLMIDCTSGIAVPPASNPTLTLRWSNDNGYNWSPEQYSTGMQTGQTASRSFFNRLGATRRNTGLDRIFELSSTDQFQVALIGAEIGFRSRKGENAV